MTAGYTNATRLDDNERPEEKFLGKEVERGEVKCEPHCSMCGLWVGLQKPTKGGEASVVETIR